MFFFKNSNHIFYYFILLIITGCLGGGYEGEKFNGKPHGLGTQYYYADYCNLITCEDDKYTGEFLNGKRHGFGMYIWNPNKPWDKPRAYKGYWANGKRHGIGVYYYFLDGKKGKDGGKIITIGIWKNSKLYFDFRSSHSGDNYEKLIKKLYNNNYNLKNVIEEKNFANSYLLSLSKDQLKKINFFYRNKKINAEPLNVDILNQNIEIMKKSAQSDISVSTPKVKEDNREPFFNGFYKVNGSNAIISGRVTDNIEVSELLIDGQVIKIDPNGTFKTELYVPRSGLNVEIVAYDIKGNKASTILKIERGNIQQASGPKFVALNPSSKRVKPNPNALALIIGVANYEKTSANALYADKDAQQFYDYATMKLGIPAKNIKELVNNKADRVEIGLAIQDWIARSTKQGKTDVYIFFAGHGLASQDGEDMFLLPYDGSPRLLKASAIRRKELFANIKQANPRSVTVFLDTCYSGVTRNEEMLVAGRPIVIKAKEQAIPDGFTLFSAASNEQISRPLEEAKHGMFSYFLMKGMEGDADTNNDKKITALELHNYVRENVVQQSSGSQTPELQGDADRVLVQFN